MYNITYYIGFLKYKTSYLYPILCIMLLIIDIISSFDCIPLHSNKLKSVVWITFFSYFFFLTI